MLEMAKNCIYVLACGLNHHDCWSGDARQHRSGTASGILQTLQLFIVLIVSTTARLKGGGRSWTFNCSLLAKGRQLGFLGSKINRSSRWVSSTVGSFLVNGARCSGRVQMRHSWSMAYVLPSITRRDMNSAGMTSRRFDEMKGLLTPGVKSGSAPGGVTLGSDELRQMFSRCMNLIETQSFVAIRATFLVMKNASANISRLTANFVKLYGFFFGRLSRSSLVMDEKRNIGLDVSRAIFFLYR